MKPDTFSWGTLVVHPGTVLYEKKGGNFFENNEWTRENIIDYYAGTLSGIPPEERKAWLARNYAPYSKLSSRLNLLRSNPPRKLLSLAVKKAAGLMAGKS